MKDKINAKVNLLTEVMKEIKIRTKKEWDKNPLPVCAYKDWVIAFERAQLASILLLYHKDKWKDILDDIVGGKNEKNNA